MNIMLLSMLAAAIAVIIYRIIAGHMKKVRARKAAEADYAARYAAYLQYQRAQQQLEEARQRVHFTDSEDQW